MDKCCTNQQNQRTHRRINGLELPLNYQQMIAWIVFTITALLNLGILIQVQYETLKIISLAIYVLLYVSHVASHAFALLMDPGEEELRKRKVNDVPEFDRRVHAHVIENGRCHLCNIYTSDKKTKHCGICNKCVYHFDHHCKWLNNCIGKRNYAAFIVCVVTALLISLITSSLCLTDIVFFLKYPQRLSPIAQHFINCTTTINVPYVKYCKNSVSFLVFLVILCVSGLAIACALLHLCCFHVYIAFIGVSTYEYITKHNSSKECTFSCCRMPYCRNLHRTNKHKKKAVPPEPTEIDTQAVVKRVKKDTSSNVPANGENRVTNLMNILINEELAKARKIFLYDKNKIHPQDENGIT